VATVTATVIARKIDGYSIYTARLRADPDVADLAQPDLAQPGLARPGVGRPGLAGAELAGAPAGQRASSASSKEYREAR
jgi:hypothetical protein